MININCPNCGSSNNKLLYDISNPSVHVKGGLPGQIKICRECDLIFKSFKKRTENLYNDAYYNTYMDNKEYSGTNRVNFFEKIIYKSYRHTKKSKPELLDIGSGTGIMLDAAKAVGYKPTGIELSSKLAQLIISKGHKVINKNVSEISLNKKFDTITMIDFIEHLERPREILIKLKSMLKKKGELIIYTPNHSSLIVKISHLFYRLGIRYPIENIFASTHTCFFTTKTLQNILVESGYKIIEICHYKYDISRPGQKISFIVKIGINIIENLGNLVGFKGFRVIIFARPL